MRQAFHIFRKDVRHLRLEISIALAAIAGFTFTIVRGGSSLTDPATTQSVAAALFHYLVPFCWLVLIARAIYGETLAGDQQFWVTRPYSHKSLAAAKALFIATFVNLPKLIADIVILRAYGFAVGPELPGLLWSQVLLTAVVVLPVAALCAVTTGFVQLIIAAFVLSLVVAGWNLLIPGLGAADSWVALEWTRLYCAGLVIAAAALATIARQYGRRGTTGSRLLAGGAVLLSFLMLMLLPWSAAFALQSRFSVQPIDISAIRIGFEPERKASARALVYRDRSVDLQVPFRVSGIREPVAWIVTGIAATIEGPGGAVWQANQLPWKGGSSFRARVDWSFYQRIRQQPVRIRGSAYLTLYGNPRRTVLPIQDRAAFLPTAGVGLCSAIRAERGILVVCRSAFRSLPDIVTFDIVGPHPGVLGAPPELLHRMSYSRRPSYSPFPAEASLIPVTQSWQFAETSRPVSGVSAVAVEPVAHVRKEFDITGLRLAEVEPGR